MTEQLKIPVPVMTPLEGLNFAPYNPRTIKREMMESLKASLVKHGLVLNLVVQKKSEAYGPMVLVGGHQRVRAIRELCEEKGWKLPPKVSAQVLDITDSQAKQLNLALNRIDGDFDPYKIGEMMKNELASMTVDEIHATGFDHDVLLEMVELTLEAPAGGELGSGQGNVGGFGASVTLSIEFDTVEQRDKVKESLKALAEEQKRKAGTIIAEAMKGYMLTKKPMKTVSKQSVKKAAKKAS